MNPTSPLLRSLPGQAAQQEMHDNMVKINPMVLVVDDDEAHRLMLKTMLEDWHYQVREAADGAEALAAVQSRPVDLVLMDMRMPNVDGIEASKCISADHPATPIIIMTAYSSIPSAVEALKAGAYDYLTKPLDFDAMKLVMQRALDHVQLQQENQDLRSRLTRLLTPEMVGTSPAMQKLLETIALVAPTQATVLITGESGTGKGLAARAIHANSARKDKPLVEVNCAAIPETLVESELFGHEKGSFTGANRQRQGRFAQADGGTLFLDEIGELTFSMQAKLLRVLQDGEIQRVGSDAAIPVDVRIVAASNRNLQVMVNEGTFREDLYYRLNVVTIETPPLRERIEDIPLLAKKFLQHFAGQNRKKVKGILPQAMDLLCRYDWPGNVRELENAIERAVILLRGESVSERELPLGVQKLGHMEEPFKAHEATVDLVQRGVTLAQMEKQMIRQVLQETAGNKSETARRLGITRRTLQLKLKKYAGED